MSTRPNEKKVPKGREKRGTLARLKQIAEILLNLLQDVLKSLTFELMSLKDLWFGDVPELVFTNCRRPTPRRPTLTMGSRTSRDTYRRFTFGPVSFLSRRDR